MGASILWPPGKHAFSLQEKLHVHKIPRFRGGGVLWVWVGGALIFLCLLFWISFFFFFARNFLAFLSVFPFFPRDFRGSALWEKSLLFRVVFLAFSKKARKGRSRECRFYFYGRADFSEFHHFFAKKLLLPDSFCGRVTHTPARAHAIIHWAAAKWGFKGCLAALPRNRPKSAFFAPFLPFSPFAEGPEGENPENGGKRPFSSDILGFPYTPPKNLFGLFLTFYLARQK